MAGPLRFTWPQVGHDPAGALSGGHNVLGLRVPVHG
jgi:hypothetical protein